MPPLAACVRGKLGELGAALPLQRRPAARDRSTGE